jgi:molybdenum-dependent DNA-binding transcriptional regulator ModE
MVYIEEKQYGRWRLKAMAEEQGLTMLDLVKTAISAEGSIYKAAQKLGVSPTTIGYHLRKGNLGFRPVVTVEFYPLDKATKGVSGQ